jgi:epoxide hydrolase 4
MDNLSESLYIETNGIRLHTIQAGPETGRGVILLHGFPETWRCWKNQIDRLAQAGYRVLAPDQRGYNLSDKPSGVENYRLEHTSADVLGLMDAMGWGKASLIGHDWGGIVAWWIAMHYPERVEKLIALNAPHPLAYKHMVTRNPAQFLRSQYALFFQIPRLPEALLRNNDWELLVKGMLASSRPGTFTEEDIDAYREAWWQGDAMAAMLNWYRANFYWRPQFPADMRVWVPTMVIWGARDIALVKGLARTSANLCVESRLVIFEGATHWVQHEEPERVADLLISFLRG